MAELTVRIEPPPISVALSPGVPIGTGVILVVLGIIASIKEQETRFNR